MEIVDYLLARKKAGGGSDVTIEQLNVTENGTYSEQGIAYSPVVVNVPAPENSYQLTDIPAGTVSTIEDGTDLPMPSLKVGIEPVQDLHGYDHPWVGGAGKNKLQVTATTKIIGGVTFTVIDDGTVVANGTASGWQAVYRKYGNVQLKADTEYILTSEGRSSELLYVDLYNDKTIIASTDYKDSQTFSVKEDITATLNIVVFINKTVTNRTIKPMIRLATETDATFEPYSNICPISGWTAANVTRCGKNLFDIDDVKNIKVSNISGLMRYGVIIEGSGEFSVSVNGESFTNNDYLYVRTYNPDGSIINTYYIISGTTVTSANLSLSQGQYFILYDAVESSLALSKERMERWKPQIEVGSTATTYEPYNGQTYTIEFKDGDNPLTVYGGTLDVTSGELVVDRAYVTLNGSENWLLYQDLPSHINQLYINIANIEPSYDVTTTMCDRYKSILIGNRNGNYNSCYSGRDGICFNIENTTVDEWEASLQANNVQVVYTLAESITYHLTPTQVRTLVGNNNIWADTGNIIEGKYFKSLT